MKVLHIITDLEIGGAEMMLTRLLEQLDSRLFRSAILSLSDRGSLADHLEALGVPVYVANLRSHPHQALAALRQVLRQFQPDLLQGWMYHGNLVAQLLALSHRDRLPCCLSIHNALYSLRAEKRLTQLILRCSGWLSPLAATTVFVSRVSAEQHYALGYSRQRSLIIPNGVDCDRFVPDPDARTRIRHALQLPESALLVGLIARFHPQKDHANFLQAAARLAAQCPDAYFLLCGAGVERSNSVLSEQVQALGLSQRVHLLGDRSDIPHLTAALDIACLASNSEAFPLVVLEAMACGVPCAVTAVGDAPWVVGETGKVVPPRDPVALAEAWQQLAALGQAGRQCLGQAARERACRAFSLHAAVQQYAALYRQFAD
ncbi:glycosyltransferase [bacterium]|nr:glycosyltransferase [bacterium]